MRGRTDPFSVTLGLGSRQDEAIRKRVVETAEKLNTKPAVVALAWVLSKPFVTSPIIGASKPHHLADAVAATELKLDARTIAKLEEPYSSKPVAGHAADREPCSARASVGSRQSAAADYGGLTRSRREGTASPERDVRREYLAKEAIEDVRRARGPRRPAGQAFFDQSA